MKNSYTTIYYKDQKISGIFAATLDNDFYDEPMLGATEIIEERIPKRDIPYFYGVSRSPLEFEATFAFEKPLDIYEIKQYLEMFYANETYQSLAFEREDGFMTPVYYVIVTGEPEAEYMRTETNKYIGYFKLNFRCNAPYGFTEGEIITDKDTFDINLSAASMASNNYEIIVTNNSGTTKDLEIINTIGESYSFEFKNIGDGEKIIIDGRNKRITSEKEGGQPSIGIYERREGRDKGFVPLMPGINKFEITSGFNIKITYRLPRFI